MDSSRQRVNGLDQPPFKSKEDSANQKEEELNIKLKKLKLDAEQKLKDKET